MSEETVDLDPQADADASPAGYVDKSIDTSIPVETTEEPVEVDAEASDTEEEVESEGDSSTPGEENADETIDAKDDAEFSDNVKHRIDDLTSKWRETERNLAAKNQELEQMRKQVAQVPVEVEPFKTVADFDYDDAKYQTYMATEIDRRATLAAEKVSANREGQSAQQKAYSEFFVAEKEFAEGVKDYHQKVGDPNLKISPDMAHAMQVEMQDPGMVYYLASNKDVAEKLFNMSPGMMRIELGSIKATRAAEKAKSTTKKVSDALPPVKKIQGGGDPVTKKITDANLTDSQFRKMREKQIANR